jgi:hypothetical protein
MTDRTHGVTRSIAFVGPLPPPLHGFSGACSAMLDLLRMSGTVAVFDRSPRDKGRARQVFRQLRQAIRYVHTVRHTPGICLYLGLCGGLGQVIDGFYVLIAMAYRKQIVVHHHSFSYINKSTLIVKSLFAVKSIAGPSESYRTRHFTDHRRSSREGSRT